MVKGAIGIEKVWFCAPWIMEHLDRNSYMDHADGHLGLGICMHIAMHSSGMLLCADERPMLGCKDSCWADS